IWAPGVDITSSVPHGRATYSGTSLASPHVAGAFAVLDEKFPDWTVDQKVAWLVDNGRPVSRGSLTKPRLALQPPEGISPAPPPPVFAPPNPTSVDAVAHDRSITVSWTPLDGVAVSGWVVTPYPLGLPIVLDDPTRTELRLASRTNGAWYEVSVQPIIG